MFMKMSGAPCACAYSRSWCTGMKSRVAIAPAAITVAVTSMTSGGSSSPTRTDAASTLTTPRPGTSAASGHPRSPRTPPRPAAPITSSADSTPTRLATSRQPFLQLDEDDDRIRLEPRVLRVPHHDRRQDRPPPRRLDRGPRQRMALRAHRPRRMAQRTAPVAALDEEAAITQAVPEELRVGRRRRREPRRQGHDSPPPVREQAARVELQDAERSGGRPAHRPRRCRW